MARTIRARRTRIALSIALVCAGASGCFALFPLDEYGPGAADGGATEGAAGDGATDAPTDANLRYEGSVAFVTSVQMNGRTLRGLSRADGICQELAADAGLDATFKAFLGDRINEALGRLVLDGGRIVTRSGGLLAESWDELLTRGPRSAFVEDERGRAVASGGSCEEGGAAWTGALPDGGVGGTDDCSRWGVSGQGDGLAGSLGRTSPEWISSCVRPCENPASLYCFQQ